MPHRESNPFLNLKCKPLTNNEPPLSNETSELNLKQLDGGWVISSDGKSINRLFKFKNYYQTMAFVNASALISHRQDHHPDIRVSYNTCQIEYSTHSIGGLSDNDFICATKTDFLLTL